MPEVVAYDNMTPEMQREAVNAPSVSQEAIAWYRVGLLDGKAIGYGFAFSDEDERRLIELRVGLYAGG